MRESHARPEGFAPRRPTEPSWRRLALTGMSKAASGKPAPGNDLLLSGLGVGAAGVLGATVLGAACPLCVVAAPGLIGAGLYQKWRARRAERTASAAPGSAGERPSEAQQVHGGAHVSASDAGEKPVVE